MAAIVVLFACQCTEFKDWSDPMDSTPPGVVSNIVVDNINGGAVIYYTLPADNDLLGVKVVYSINEGEWLEVFASAHNDSIMIEGFSDTEEHSVELYVMDKSRNLSQAVQTMVHPLTPPVELIRQSLQLEPSFGGLKAIWDNPSQKAIAVIFSVKDSIGEWIEYDTYYSNTTTGKSFLRGLKNTPQEINIVIRDKWQHYSSTFNTTLTPLFEEEILGRTPQGQLIWSLYGAAGTGIYRGEVKDASVNSGNFRYISDGLVSEASYFDIQNNVYSTFTGIIEQSDYARPLYFILDMGKEAKYSRFKWYMRPRLPLYSGRTFTDFEIWGTNSPKPLETIGSGSKEDNLKYWTEWALVGGTDAWKNDWVKIADCQVTLPSGTTDYNLLTEEDREYILAGFDFEVQETDLSFRYLRFVGKQFNVSQAWVEIAELKFWGAY
jgi:hypothetical protein